MSGYQGNPLNPYAGASPWGAYGSNALTPWANSWGGYGGSNLNLNYQGGDMGLSDISNWLPYQTYLQFQPQQPQGQWQQWQPQQGQMQQQPGGYVPQGQVGQQPSQQQQPDPAQQQQMQQWQDQQRQQQQMQALMQIAGVGRPNLGLAGTYGQ